MPLLFLALLTEFGAGDSHGGLAVFPSQPARGLLRSTNHPHEPGHRRNAGRGESPCHVLSGGGNTPLLGGLEAAAAMLGSEEKRAVVLLTDGHQNSRRLALRISETPKSSSG